MGDMMTIRDEMVKARALIQQKRFDEARAILEQIDHPKAREWLAKINKVSPATTSTQKPPTHSAKSTATSSNTLPIIIGGIVITVIVALVAAVVLVVSGDDDSSSSTNQTSSNDTAAQTTSNDADDTSSDSSDAAANTGNDAGGGAAAGQSVVGSGLRIPIFASGGLIRLEIPQGWICDCGTVGGHLKIENDFDSWVDVDVASFAFDPDRFIGVPLAEVLQEEIRDDQMIVSQETLSANGREVLFAAVIDEGADDDEQEHIYLVNDSDGHAIAFEIPNFINDRDRLRDAILLMAGTVEGETGDASTQLLTQFTQNTLAYNAELDRWRLSDMLDDERENTVQLPPDWSIETASLGFKMPVKSGSAATSATAIAYVSPVFYNSSTLADIAVELNSDASETIQSQGSTTVNGREVYYVTVFDTQFNSDSVFYYVRDSDGDLVSLIIQPDVPKKESLHDDVLMMAGNVESEAVDYMTRLIRAGLVEGAAPPDDGFAPLTE